MPRIVGSSRLGEVFFAMCKSVDTPVSLGLWLRFKYGEHKQLATFSIRPEWYCTAWQFRLDYMCSEYLSKYSGLNTGIDVTAVALQSFATAESVCLETNKRLSEARLRGSSPRVEAVMFTAKRKIADLLGPYSFESWATRCKWGPGATYSLKGVDANLENKVREDYMSITAAALPFFRRVISDDYAWLFARGISAEGPCCLLHRDFNIVPGARVTTVPKNAKTERTIAIEPTLNQFLQGGVGNYIRGRLTRVGIDLNDQSHNQTGARTAFERHFATVDLKAASDTVSLELIYELLPFDWARTLDLIRSPQYQLPDGSWHRFEKFSTMGNGFTFELESLVFWALSSAVTEVLKLRDSKGQVLVYGDDILVHESALPLLIEVFSFCGFSVNSEKTHFATAFRESCGKHYFLNVDVTPIYQKEIPNVLEEIYRLANRLRRLAFRLGFGFCSDGILRSAWLAAIRNERITHAVPIDSQDDDGLALPIDEIKAFGLDLYSDSWRITVPVLSFRPAKLRLSEHSGLLASWLRFTPSDQPIGEAFRIGTNMVVIPYSVLYGDRRAPYGGAVGLRRRGKYVKRRRNYPLGCRTAPWI